MKLRKLTLHGYKTFASKTAFEFTEGITAIVGPNGSGKSNIADAIRWVLGEQSYGTLRGKRTVDMIFAGSQQRPRAGMAQAVLTLDNSAGWLPIEYSEIEIGRRAYRSGENEYLLNGQRVRLKDVIELLASGGLAHHAYTIISQGLVDQALSLRADERRLLFEGAAGVSQYKLRRAETLRRLQETNHNLERLHDILSEIKPRLNSLKRQANRANNYGQIASDLKYHLRIWYGYRWERATIQLRTSRQENKNSRQMWEAGRQKQLTVQGELDDLRRRVHVIQQTIQDKEDVRNSLRDQAASERQALAVLQERQNSIKTQLAELQIEIPAIESQQSLAQQETDGAISELKAAQVEFSEKEAELRDFEFSSSSIQAEIKNQQNRIEELTQAKDDLQDEIAQAGGQKKLFESQIEKLAIELSFEKSKDDAQAEVDRLVDVELKGKQELLQISRKLAEQRDNVGILQKASSLLQEQFNVLEARRVQLRETVLSLSSRLTELENLSAKGTEITGDFEVIGKFVDLVSIPEKYRQPITAALQHRLMTFVVSDDKSFWKLLAAADGRPLSATNLSFIKAPPDIPVPEQEGIIGWADSFITAEDDIRTLVRLLLGHVLLVQDATTAYDMTLHLPKGSLAVSLDGFVAHAGGLFEFGADPQLSIEISAQEKISDLQQELEDQTVRLEEIQLELDQLNAKIDDSKIDLAKMSKTVSETEVLEREADFQVLENRRSRELAEQHLQFVFRNLESSQVDIKTKEQSLQQIDELLTVKESEAVALNQAIIEARQQIALLPVAETGVEREQKTQRVEAAKTILAGRQAVVDSRRATLNQLDDQLRRRLERQQELLTRGEHLAIDKKSQALEGTLDSLAQINEAINPLKGKLSEGRERISQIEEEIARLQRTNHELEGQYTQARINYGQAETQIEALKERITADLGVVALSNPSDLPSQSPLPIAEVVEELPVVESLPDDIEEIIGRYRSQLTRMGPVNLNAPDEYDQTKDRFDFLNQQIEDLTTTKERLEEVIEDLDHLTSTAFAETVKRVDREFGTVFQRLFGGGSAQLVLTDPDDLTLTGVDIVARLPRRREQGLALLSGGERSLTAVALLFSLLMVSPTPFCVLDEVDAMLDEANVNRFRDLLEELSGKTQFILITHNRGTVQVAETVYGVSMGADSVSQVISIRPEDYLTEHN